MPVIPRHADQHLPQAENAFKLALLLALLLGSFVLTQALLHGPLAHWPLGLKLLPASGFAVLNGVFILGFGALAHDAVHRVLFRNTLLNEWLGGFASAMMLTPFNANRQFHLTHHSYAHQPGLDPENAMHHRPFWQAATLGSLIGLLLQYRIFCRNLWTRFDDPHMRGRALRDALCLLLATGVYVGLPLMLGLDLFLTTGVTLLLFPLVFAFRAVSDHYGLPAVPPKSARRQDIVDGSDWQRSVEPASVTGWVVLTYPWLEWLWSSVNYHEVHHKYPWLAHCHLKPVFEQTRDTVPYAVVRGYTRSFLARLRQSYYGD